MPELQLQIVNQNNRHRPNCNIAGGAETARDVEHSSQLTSLLFYALTKLKAASEQLSNDSALAPMRKSKDLNSGPNTKSRQNILYLFVEIKTFSLASSK